jgi:opacity protein-like surface antigen
MSKIKRHVIVAATAALTSIASAQTPASQEPPANEPPPLAKPPSTTDAVIESTQRTVRSTAEWLASGIDKRFGDKPFSDGGTVTDGQIGLSYLKRDGHGSNLGLRFNARFRLPNLSEIPYVFVGSDDERSIVTDQPDRRTPARTNPPTKQLQQLVLRRRRTLAGRLGRCSHWLPRFVAPIRSGTSASSMAIDT